MKIYIVTVNVGNYEIVAFGETREKCKKALVSAYRENFGTFRENGFKNQKDWLEYHGIYCDECFQEVNLNSAIVW